MPTGEVRANGGRGRSVGRQAKENNRRCTPIRPASCRGRRVDEPPQPAHRARRAGIVIIAGARKHRNRHHPRNDPPVLPLMELGHSVLPHQPDEAGARPAAEQGLKRIDGVAGAGPSLEIADSYPGSACHEPRRRQPGGIRRHALGRFQWIAGRDQPPYFVQVQRFHRGQAHPPVAAMRWVEASTEETYAPHVDGLASIPPRPAPPGRIMKCPRGT
jgi:hypothetical protein